VFKRTLKEKGEEFFKNKNKDLEKIKQFEKNNFLKCNTKDYSKVFNHKKTNDFKPKISSSFYQNLETPISSRSEATELKSSYCFFDRNYYNKNYSNNNFKAKICNNYSTSQANSNYGNNVIMLSINEKHIIHSKNSRNFPSKMAENESIASIYEEEKYNTDDLHLVNKNGNFLIKNGNEEGIGKDKTGKKPMLYGEFGSEAQREYAVLSHRKTRSLELVHNKDKNNKDLNSVQKQTFESNKSNTRSCVEDENNINKTIRKIYTNKGNIYNGTAELKADDENQNNSYEELKEKMNKASNMNITSNLINL